MWNSGTGILSRVLRHHRGASDGAPPNSKSTASDELAAVAGSREILRLASLVVCVRSSYCDVRLRSRSRRVGGTRDSSGGLRSKQGLSLPAGFSLTFVLDGLFYRHRVGTVKSPDSLASASLAASSSAHELLTRAGRRPADGTVADFALKWFIADPNRRPIRFRCHESIDPDPPLEDGQADVGARCRRLERGSNTGRRVIGRKRKFERLVQRQQPNPFENSVPVALTDI